MRFTERIEEEVKEIANIIKVEQEFVESEYFIFIDHYEREKRLVDLNRHKNTVEQLQKILNYYIILLEEENEWT